MPPHKMEEIFKNACGHLKISHHPCIGHTQLGMKICFDVT